MKIGLFSLVSPVHNREVIDSTLSGFVNELNESFEIVELSDKELERHHEFDLILVFVKTGGSENMFKEVYQKLPKPVYLLSTSLHNSLAASLEILSWVKIQGGRGEIIHGDIKQVREKIKILYRANQALRKFKESRIGLIGKPSDWLIASNVDYEKLERKLGIKIIQIEMDEVINLYQKVSRDEAIKISDKFENGARNMVENSKEDLNQAAKVYLALEEIVGKYKLNSLTIRCFDLVTELNTTGCLALSLLNDEGIIAGCEGDLPATITMLLTYYITGKRAFMANPVSIDQEKDEVIFAHCTIPTKLAEEYIVRSHFETGIGVGIQGVVDNGPVTIFKLGGRLLESKVVKTGQIIENLNSPNACRTQIKVKLNSSVNFLLTDPVGNHHVIVPGCHYNVINKFFELLN